MPAKYVAACAVLLTALSFPAVAGSHPDRWQASGYRQATSARPWPDREPQQLLARKWEELSPEEKKRVKEARERYKELPREKKKKLREEWEKMPKKEKEKYKIEREHS